MLNKAILVGRLTADPELRYTPSNIPVLSFSIAVDRPYSKGAERQTDFINCVAWRQTAEFISKYFHKGNAIAIDGRIQVSNYQDREGNKRTRVEVLAENVSFVESKSAAARSYDSAPAASFNPAPAAPATPSAGSSYSSGTANDFAEIDDEDDLPF